MTPEEYARMLLLATLSGHSTEALAGLRARLILAVQGNDCEEIGAVITRYPDFLKDVILDAKRPHSILVESIRRGTCQTTLKLLDLGAETSYLYDFNVSALAYALANHTRLQNQAQEFIPLVLRLIEATPHTTLQLPLGGTLELTYAHFATRMHSSSQEQIIEVLERIAEKMGKDYLFIPSRKGVTPETFARLTNKIIVATYLSNLQRTITLTNDDESPPPSPSPHRRVRYTLAIQPSQTGREEPHCSTTTVTTSAAPEAATEAPPSPEPPM